MKIFSKSPKNSLWGHFGQFLVKFVEKLFFLEKKMLCQLLNIPII